MLLRKGCPLLLLLAVAGTGHTQETTADKIDAMRAKAAVLYKDACDFGKVKDHNAYARYFALLTGEFKKVAAQYQKEVAATETMKAAEKKKELERLDKELIAIAYGDDLCLHPLDGSKVQPGTSEDGAKAQTYLNDDEESFSIVGGVEQSGLSSLANQTGGFLNVFTRSPRKRRNQVWARVRLISAPQEATDNIASTFVDPTGLIKKVDYKKVGQAVDYVFGTETRLTGPSHGPYSISFITGFGATTPLTSGNVVLRYQLPERGSQECATLLTKYSPASGYNPGLTANTDPDPANTHCASGNYKFLALTNQERSNFLKKWGVGIRTVTRFCPAGKKECKAEEVSRGIVDFTIGQDQAFTGGVMQHFVFKVDAVHPLPFAGQNILYLFGSAALRTARNRNFDPLILKTADATQAPVPSADVIVLPLRQADRDFYRIGLALDIKKIFDKLTTTGKEGEAAEKK